MFIIEIVELFSIPLADIEWFNIMLELGGFMNDALADPLSMPAPLIIPFIPFPIVELPIIEFPIIPPFPLTPALNGKSGTELMPTPFIIPLFPIPAIPDGNPGVGIIVLFTFILGDIGNKFVADMLPKGSIGGLLEGKPVPANDFELEIPPPNGNKSPG